MVEVAVDAALQEREVRLHGVRVHEPTMPHVLVGAVVDGAMAGECGADFAIDGRLIIAAPSIGIRIIDALHARRRPSRAAEDERGPRNRRPRRVRGAVG